MGAQNLLCATELYRLTYSLPEADGRIYWTVNECVVGTELTCTLFALHRNRISMGALAHRRLHWPSSVESRHQWCETGRCIQCLFYTYMYVAVTVLVCCLTLRFGTDVSATGIGKI